MKMRIWPKSVEEGLGGLLRVVAFFLVAFTALFFICQRVSDHYYDLHDRVPDRLWATLGDYTRLGALVSAGLLLVLSLAAGVVRHWKILRWGLLLLGLWIVFGLVLGPAFSRAREKPVIYLYPESEQAINVKLRYDGTLVHAYPEYSPEGWQVLAKPSGELINTQTGRSHYCLFWEGADNHAYGMDEGFVVAGKDTAAFLESTLATLGLSEREANEFIIYWLPRMEKNAYNLVSFPSDEYARRAHLEITPKPDTLVRVFMVFEPVAKPVHINPPQLKPVVRRGFTVVEWGGTELDWPASRW